MSGPSSLNTTWATSPTTTVEITAGRKNVERKKRQPGMRSWISQARIIGTVTWIGTEIANSTLLRSEVRKIGSSIRASKLAKPTHSRRRYPVPGGEGVIDDAAERVGHERQHEAQRRQDVDDAPEAVAVRHGRRLRPFAQGASDCSVGSCSSIDSIASCGVFLPDSACWSSL